MTEQKLQGQKWEMINKAKEERKSALGELYRAENIIWYIPNLEDRQHFKALIAGTITSATASSAIGKILSVGLMLIASIADSAYDRFCEMRQHLIKAEYHFEMAKFYDRLSLEFNTEDTSYNSPVDQGTSDYIRAINNLTVALLTAQCIEEKWLRGGVCNIIEDSMDYLLKRGENMSSKLETLVENMGEVLSECSDEELREEISVYVEASWDNIKYAEEAWKKRTSACA